jgi:hypothetical protein
MSMQRSWWSGVDATTSTITWSVSCIADSEFHAYGLMQRLYLISSVHSLIKRIEPSPVLLAMHIKLLTQRTPSDRAKTLRMAGKYTGKVPKSATVWLARLEAEKALGATRAVVEATWREARRHAEGDGAEKVWLWMSEHFSGDSLEERAAIYEVRPERSLVLVMICPTAF